MVIKWSEKVLVGILACAVLLGVSLYGSGSIFGVATVPLVVFGENYQGKYQAVKYADTAYVSLKLIEETFGVSALWEETSYSVIFGTKPDQMFTGRLFHGYQTVNVYINGVQVKSTTPAIYRAGQAFLPLDMFTEFGLTSDFKGGIAYLGSLHQGALPVVGSEENLAKLLAWQGMNYYGPTFRFTLAPESATVGTKTVDSSAPANQSGNYSETNIQVAGVDEADIIKTDGQYIYQVRNNLITVTKAVPAGQMKVVSNIKFSDEAFWPTEMYIQDKYLVVIGNSNMGWFLDGKSEGTKDSGAAAPDTTSGKMLSIWRPNYSGTTKAYIYDLSNMEA
ncbi:MAG: beta-propeller domain-containing protein, partial [bacterium]|nr:beta-propeller domain-containing protein [bacterium]